MFPRLLSLLLIFVLSTTLRAQPWDIDTLSPQARISLMTCEPGPLIYATFGHSAIRVQDTAQGYDYVFNYGTFDFQTPNFTLLFIRGKLLYYLTVEPYAYFEMDYVEDYRSIIEQPLLLDAKQAQTLFTLLKINAQPQNRAYHYDFIRDNCSSRIRDILKSALGQNLQFIENKDGKYKTSYRDLIDSYERHDEWTDFGIDLLLGMPVDKRARNWGSMFLPEYLMAEFEKAVIIGDTTRQLAGAPVYIKKYPRHNTERNPLNSPQVLFWTLFAIYLVWLIRRPSSHHINPIFPVVTFTITGIIGWALLFMWFGTDHATTKWNLNLFWAFPLSFPLAFYFFKKELPTWVRKYFHGYRVFLTVFLFMMVILPQQFHKAVIPLVLLQILQLSAMLPLPKLDNPAEEI